jgi:hypothetical protein
MEKGYMILSRIGVRPFNKNSREEKPEYTYLWPITTMPVVATRNLKYVLKMLN